MSGAASSVPRERVPGGKLRLFGADGGFLRRVDVQQADELLAAGLAELRGRDIRLIALERYRCGLDGLRPTEAASATNPRGCWTFRRGAW